MLKAVVTASMHGAQIGTHGAHGKSGVHRQHPTKPQFFSTHTLQSRLQSICSLSAAATSKMKEAHNCCPLPAAHGPELPLPLRSDGT